MGFHQSKRDWGVADLLVALAPLPPPSHHCSSPSWLLLQTAFMVATFVTRPEGTIDVPRCHCNMGWCSPVAVAGDVVSQRRFVVVGVVGVWDAGCGWLWLLVAMFETKNVCLFTMRR